MNTGTGETAPIISANTPAAGGSSDGTQHHCATVDAATSKNGLKIRPNEHSPPARQRRSGRASRAVLATTRRPPVIGVRQIPRAVRIEEILHRQSDREGDDDGGATRAGDDRDPKA